MKQRLKHETRELTEEQSSVARDQRTEKSLSFDSPEAMIRHDAGHTAVPPHLRDRVMRSIAEEASQTNPAPWWKRWMRF